METTNKSIVLEELQHALDHTGLFPIMREVNGEMIPVKLLEIIMRKNPNMGQAAATREALERVHAGTFERLGWNTELPAGVLSEIERRRLLEVLGIK